MSLGESNNLSYRFIVKCIFTFLPIHKNKIFESGTFFDVTVIKKNYKVIKKLKCNIVYC